MNNSNSSEIPRKRSTSSLPSSNAGAASFPALQLSKDLAEFVGLCVSSGVEFVIVGGFALAYHGAPRYTQDIDLFVAISESNAAKIEKILRDFGVSEADVSRNDLLTPGHIVQVGRPPNRVDVITAIDGVTFEQAWATKVPIVLSGHSCWAIGLDCLLQNKKASGRPQDIVDVRNLEKAHGRNS